MYCLRDRLHGSASILRGTVLDAVPFLRLFIFWGASDPAGFDAAGDWYSAKDLSILLLFTHESHRFNRGLHDPSSVPR